MDFTENAERTLCLRAACVYSHCCPFSSELCFHSRWYNKAIMNNVCYQNDIFMIKIAWASVASHPLFLILTSLYPSLSLSPFSLSLSLSLFPFSLYLSPFLFLLPLSGSCRLLVGGITSMVWQVVPYLSSLSLSLSLLLAVSFLLSLSPSLSLSLSLYLAKCLSS